MMNLAQELDRIKFEVKAEMYRLQMGNEILKACEAILRLEEEGYNHKAISHTFDFCIECVNDLMVDPTQSNYSPEEYYETRVFLHDKIDELLTNLVSKLVA